LKRNPLNDIRTRGWLLQALLVLALLASASYLIGNAAENLAARHIPVGFEFLGQAAGFDIEQTFLEWNPSDSNARALLVGLSNTLVAAVLGIVFASLLGLLIGLMRLSPNPLFRATGGAYVFFVRNTPLLLLVVFFYFVVLRSLPLPRASWSAGGAVFLNVRGLYVPEPRITDAQDLAVVVVAGITAFLLFFIASRGRMPGGRRWVLSLACLALAPLAILAAGLVAQPKIVFDYPSLVGFNFKGGLHLYPEFVALVAALSIGEAAYIAEIVRAGVLSVDRGQREAARALGLRGLHIYRHIVIPQALLVIIPPLTTEYLSLTKATSLGVTIAFPDLVQVFAGIVLSRTGHEIEIMFTTMAIYLLVSLATSLFMNWYNRRIQFIRR
jgi:general L-amino acid transport system permease protein